MSDSKKATTYYYKKSGTNVYHWETGCSKNNYSANDSDWVKTNNRTHRQR